MGKQLAIAITGASGSGYGVSLLNRLASSDLVDQIVLMLSDTGRRCLKDECGLYEEDLAGIDSKIQLQDERDLGAPISSGSFLQNGLAIVPCSTGTLGRIASGTSDSLITRTADVCLKEKRPLILCLRESPLNRIHLKNMLSAHDAGAVLMPLIPSVLLSPWIDTRSIRRICNTYNGPTGPFRTG